jgi:acyl carrier protein
MDTLSKPEALRRLQDVFRHVFDDDTLTLSLETTASDIPGWDSLAQVKIILACERAFGVKLRPREINALENVDEMTEHLRKAVAKTQG